LLTTEGATLGNTPDSALKTCGVPIFHPYLGERRVANQDRRMPAEAPHTLFLVPMSPNRTWNSAPPSRSVIPCHWVWPSRTSLGVVSN